VTQGQCQYQPGCPRPAKPWKITHNTDNATYSGEVCNWHWGHLSREERSQWLRAHGRKTPAQKVK